MIFSSSAGGFFSSRQFLKKSPARRSAGGWFKADDRFVGPRIAQFIPGKTFDGLGIIAQRVKFSLTLPGLLPLFFQFRIQFVNPAAHLLVLLDERQVSHPNEQQHGDGHEGDDCLREPAPDAKIYFHARSLTPRSMEAKADFVVTRRKMR